VEASEAARATPAAVEVAQAVVAQEAAAQQAAR